MYTSIKTTFTKVGKAMGYVHMPRHTKILNNGSDAPYLKPKY